MSTSSSQCSGVRIGSAWLQCQQSLLVSVSSTCPNIANFVHTGLHSRLLNIMGSQSSQTAWIPSDYNPPSRHCRRPRKDGVLHSVDRNPRVRAQRDIGQRPRGCAEPVRLEITRAWFLRCRICARQRLCRGCRRSWRRNRQGQERRSAKTSKIAGWIHGSSLRVGHGTYAQYVQVDDRNFWRIPDGVSFEEAASYSAVYQTASQGLYLTMQLPEPYPPPAPHGTPLLVWGGASSVGTMVIQLAKLSGFTVVTTASPKNHAYLTGLGADYVLPYNDPNTPAEIRRLTKNQLYLAYDAVTEHGSTRAVLDAFGSAIPAGKTKQLVVVLPVAQADLGPNAEGVALHFIIVGSLLGREMNVVGVHVPASPRDYAFSLHSYETLERLVAEKKIQPQRLKVMGGLENVPEGFAYMKAGKNSAEKIIYHPWETKGI